MTELKLVADLGGTHLRMALAAVQPGQTELRTVEVVETRSITNLGETLAAYWQRQGAPPLAMAAVCVAGPVQGQGRAASARMTNVDLAVSAQALSNDLAATPALLVNDFAAVAAAAPRLTAADLRLHGAVAPPREAVTVVLGPGTGLGVAASLPGSLVVAGEGGHARLAAPDDEAAPMWQRLAARYDFIAAEHVLCGRGLATLHQAVAELHGVEAVLIDAAEVWRRNLAGDAVAGAAVRHFTAALGAYAGDLSLIFGAAGVLLAGGILPRWGEGFDTALFRRAFEAKEPGYRARLAAVPSATIVHPYPALLGLAGLRVEP